MKLKFRLNNHVEGVAQLEYKKGRRMKNKEGTKGVLTGRYFYDKEGGHTGIDLSVISQEEHEKGSYGRDSITGIPVLLVDKDEE